MPRRKTVPAGSAFQQVQQQARALLPILRTEIRGKEAELERLKEEETALGRRAGRLDWTGILQQLPKQFKAADVRGIGAVAGKRSSEIFAAITRWIEGGSVKRKSRGLYEHA
jgi:hypothetical protein